MLRRLTRMPRRALLPAVSVGGVLLSIACAGSVASTTTVTQTARRPTAPQHAVAAARSVPPVAHTVPADPPVSRTAPAAPPVSRTVAAAASVRTRRPTGSRPLAGKVVGIDPGHNGRNYADPAFINRLIWNGRQEETCDTTGTETDAGYTEARFNFNVAQYLTRDLRSEGARVVLTRTTNDGVGPCVTTRSQILNRARSNVAIDIHADGGPPGGRGFAILEPVADGPNDRVIAASRRFGGVLRAQYGAVTGMPESTYDGTNGVAFRDDLAGLNLTTVPKVLIETGNMRNATDAAELVRPAFQRLAATAFARAITLFLTGRAVG